MILDKGICTIFRKENIARKGDKPRFDHKAYAWHWYGVLDHATVQTQETEGREEMQIDLRIRILQNRAISNHDVLVLANTQRVEDVIKAYEITRAYHGRDDESGDLITDLTLRRVTP